MMRKYVHFAFFLRKSLIANWPPKPSYMLKLGLKPGTQQWKAEYPPNEVHITFQSLLDIFSYTYGTQQLCTSVQIHIWSCLYTFYTCIVCEDEKYILRKINFFFSLWSVYLCLKYRYLLPNMAVLLTWSIQLSILAPIYLFMLCYLCPDWTSDREKYFKWKKRFQIENKINESKINVNVLSFCSVLKCSLQHLGQYWPISWRKVDRGWYTPKVNSCLYYISLKKWWLICGTG